MHASKKQAVGVLFEALERADVKDADRGVAAARVQQLFVREQTQHLPQGKRDNRLRALRAARPHTVGCIGVCDQEEGEIELVHCPHAHHAYRTASGFGIYPRQCID